MKHHSDLPSLIADGAVHVAGIVASISASALLIAHVTGNGDTTSVAAVAIYTGVIIFSFIVSGIYNLWQWDTLRDT
ncbi:MAG: hypothetical protein ACPG5U_04415, partial [Planktomarina sp.]